MDQERNMQACNVFYFCTNSDPMTRMNVASVRLATARAQRVLPVPALFENAKAPSVKIVNRTMIHSKTQKHQSLKSQ